MEKTLLKSLGIYLFLCFFNLNLCAKKPKIVVFTSKGGNGHMAACATLKDVLSDCEVRLINPIDDYFHKTFNGEEWYVSLVQKGWVGMANFVTRYPAPIFFDINISSFKRRFLKILEQENPDLLISVIPFLNYPAAWAAKRCNIPFLLITLDADLTNWLLNLGKCHDYNISITVNTKTPRIEKQLARRHIPRSCIYEVGAPLRKEFFEPKNKEAIRKEWNVSNEKKVIMLMRGGTGSSKLIDYVCELVKIKIPAHLLVCIGRNTDLIPKLNRIKALGCVSFSIVPFTPKIPDLMAIADLLITQPSPNVCNEAMCMNLPMLIDMSTTCLFWERATIDWLGPKNCGQVFRHMHQINKLVAQIFEKSSKKDESCKIQVPKTVTSFNTEIRKIIMEKLGYDGTFSIFSKKHL